MMKRHFTLFILAFVVATFIACSPDDSDNYIDPYNTIGRHLSRTVIAYVPADNNLSDYLKDDTTEMITGSETLSDSCRLILYADFPNNNPFIAEIRKGKMTKVREYEQDFSSMNPDSMLSVMQWIVKNYPADEYGTIFEGHANGSTISNDTAATGFVKLNAYGYDTTVPSGSNSQWLNIPTLAKVLGELPHMGFIFFDCCCMGNVETAYELRNNTDYIIAPVCETPAKGAPYSKVVPLLNGDVSYIGQHIIDAYIAGSNFESVCGICLTTIKTSELENLRDVTKSILQEMYSKQDTASTKKLTVSNKNAIYYYKGKETSGQQILQDMKSMFRIALSDNLITQSSFDSWNTALEKTVIYKSTPEKPESGYKPLWITNTYNYPNINFYSFYDYFDDEHYGGLSMIFPISYYDRSVGLGYPSVNKTMFQLSWCNAVGWHEFGW